MDHNPLGIPFDKINEKKGTMTFKIKNGYLMSTYSENILFFDVQVGESRFFLNRDKNFDLVFTHWSTKTGIRVAKIDLKEFNVGNGLFVALIWSENENRLHVGEIGKSNIKFVNAEQKEGKIRLGNDGALYEIGDGVKMVHITSGGHDVLLPTAKELWDFIIEKVNVLIDGCKLKDFLFETTLAQQCLVMLMTGLEIYTKTRFLEMEKEGKNPNIDALLHEFARNSNEIKNYSQTTGKSIFQSLFEIGGKGLINFQDWDKCKTAYNKGYDIKFGDLPDLKGKTLENIQKYAEWRHKIIHSRKDMAVLNINDVPPAEPLFSNKEFIEMAKNDFVEFVEKLHKQTI